MFKYSIKKCSFLIINFFFNFLFSQSNSEVYTERYQLVKDSIYDLIKKNDFTAIDLSNEYIEISRRLKKTDDISRGFYFRSIAYFNLKKFNEAYKDIETSIELSKNNEIIVRNYLFKGLIITRKDGWSNNEIIENYLKALNIAEENDYHYWALIASSRLAAFHSLSGNINNSIKIQKNIIKEFDKSDKFGIDSLEKYGLRKRNTYNYITKNFLSIEEPDSAKIYNEKFFFELKKDTINYSLWSKIYHENNLHISLLENNIEVALENFKKRNSVRLNSLKKVQTTDSLYYMGWILYLKKDYLNAIKTLESMDQFTLTNYKLHNYFAYKNQYKFLSKSYINLGKKEKAQYYFDLLIESIEKNNYLQNNIKIQLKDYETNIYSRELSLIKKDVTRKGYIMIIILILFMVTLVAFVYHTKKINKRNKLKFDNLNKKLKAQQIKPKININKEQKTLDIKDEEISRIIENLRKLERKKFYLKNDCTLFSTAKAINTNTSYLSKVVNNLFGTTFNEYINELRIKYFLLKIKEDTLYRKYTIKSIANEIGFKSKETFNKAFKKHTGILPSYYIKQINKE